MLHKQTQDTIDYGGELFFIIVVTGISISLNFKFIIYYYIKFFFNIIYIYNKLLLFFRCCCVFFYYAIYSPQKSTMHSKHLILTKEM